MRDDFKRDFSDITLPRLDVVFNAFEDYESHTEVLADDERITMLYAGTFYGTRRLSIIATVLSDMLRAKEISATTFRLQLFTNISDDDRTLIQELGIANLVEIHKPVPYEQIKKIMCAADILFLPSGEEHAYAIPFKFFDYISVRRPILAVAPLNSSINQLMDDIDCGEFAELGSQDGVARALERLLDKEKQYTFEGSEQFRWENSAQQYIKIINRALDSRDAGA
jgi:glycosyltransferase involved in cell wall biosynthesis